MELKTKEGEILGGIQTMTDIGNDDIELVFYNGTTRTINRRQLARKQSSMFSRRWSIFLEIDQLIDIGKKVGLTPERLNVYVRFMLAYSPGAHPDYVEECAERFMGNPLKRFDEEWHGILNNRHFGIDWEKDGA